MTAATERAWTRHARRTLTAMIGLLMLGSASMAEDQPAADDASVVDVFPALTSAALSHARLADLPEGIVLQAGPLRVTAATIDEEIDQSNPQMRPQLEKNRFFLLENIVTEPLLAQAARKSGDASAEADDKVAIQAHLEKVAASATISEQEIDAFFRENSAMMGGAKLEQVKTQIQQHLLQGKQQEMVAQHIRSLGDVVEIRVDRAWTKAQAELAMDNPVDKARASGKPSMVDFGAHGCGPCDMMTPILADMEQKYQSKANIVFVPVREEQILGARYGIRSIPVQIFFDADGREIFRHNGFLPQNECEAWLQKAGAK